MDESRAHVAAGTGELVVQRGDDTLGALAPLKVVVDGAVVAGLMPNQVIAIPLTEGGHLVRAGRSRPATVVVQPGGTTYVLVANPPMPSTWRFIVSPLRSSRPTVDVRQGPVASPGPGKPTAAQVFLDGQLKTLVPAIGSSVIAWGVAMVLAGLLVAVLIPEEPIVVIAGAALALIGLAAAAAGVWVRRRPV